MNKESYIAQKDEILDQQKALTKRLSELRDTYIKECAPCQIDDKVKLTHNSGRTENMVVKGFGLYKDEVYIEKFNKIKSNGDAESTFRYISTGHGEIEKL